jgi:glycosyltransferase involved in cell wall biosynthesis
MAVVPYFVLGPNTLMSIAGLIHGPDRTVPTPAEDWRQATVDVVIPALNEQYTIPLCLASLARQTLRPRRIILVDDGSRDRTLEHARTFCDVNGMELIAIRRRAPIGKTPTVKRQAREFDSDVQFILDADTVLESDNYIERTVQELYQAVGIASACGTILPLRHRDRAALLDDPRVRRFLRAEPEARLEPPAGWLRRLRRGVTNLYRDVLYLFLQRFIYLGQMVFFGTIQSPVGCAVAYRRRYVKDLFDHFEPLLGDDLTNCEDIFIGFALLAEGYRNIQVRDVYARSMEPEMHRLPRQVYLWSSSFLQSCFYFDALLRSPFKAVQRYRQARRSQRLYGKEIQEKRKIQEPYRQRFGRTTTARLGRPMGWVILTAALEKVFFPTTLTVMMILGMWEAVGLTVLVETLLGLGVLAYVAEGRRLEYIAKGIAVFPIRYASLLFDLYTMVRFLVEARLVRSRRWRK